MQQILENCRISHYKALDIFAHFCNNMRWVMIKKKNVTSTCECVLEEVKCMTQGLLYKGHSTFGIDKIAVK